MITRRELLIAIGTLGVSSFTAIAQPRPYRVAWMGARYAGGVSPFFKAYQSGMRELGWIEGRNLVLTTFQTGADAEDPVLVGKAVIDSAPDLIVTYGRDVVAISKLQPKMPVVFAFSGNPVDGKVVQSFAHPGGNMTGISLMSLELAGKRIEMLKEIVPGIKRLGVLTRPEHPGEPRERAVSEEIARKVGLSVAYAEIRTGADLDEALRTLARERCDALLVFPDGAMASYAPTIHKFALERRIPTVSGWSIFAEGGFLLTYGPNLEASYKRLSVYVDKILKGAKPADLPVELPSTIDTVVNLKTARALGLQIPNSILVRADKVIE